MWTVGGIRTKCKLQRIASVNAAAPESAFGVFYIDDPLTVTGKIQSARRHSTHKRQPRTGLPIVPCQLTTLHSAQSEYLCTVRTGCRGIELNRIVSKTHRLWMGEWKPVGPIGYRPKIRFAICRGRKKQVPGTCRPIAKRRVENP